MLPETTRTRIEQEASEYAKDVPDNACFELCDGYIDGATVEAEKAQRLADALEKIIEWVNDTGIKEVALDDKLGMALYHSKHLAINALQKWRGEK